METMHTLTPWHAPGMGEIHDADHNLIAHIAFSTGEHDDDQVGTEADAKFIVRACNSHDQLVAALKDALAVIRDYLEYEHNGDPWTEDARAMGEMDIDDYEHDGRLERAEAILAASGEQS